MGKDKENTGKVAQVIGPVVDVIFEGSKVLPEIYEAMEVFNELGHRIVLECQQHLGEDTVRSIAMDGTDGISRGMPVHLTGGPITMPAGEEVRGRLFNVIGEPIDGLGPVKTEKRYDIHSDPPKYDQLKTGDEVLLTRAVDGGRAQNVEGRAALQAERRFVARGLRFSRRVIHALELAPGRVGGIGPAAVDLVNVPAHGQRRRFLALGPGVHCADGVDGAGLGLFRQTRADFRRIKRDERATAPPVKQAILHRLL